MEHLRRYITTALDVLALLLIAAGAAFALAPLAGLGAGLIVAGAVVAVGSAFAASDGAGRP